MMHTTHMGATGYGFGAALLPLHFIGMTVFLVGLIFLVYWAVKTMTPAQLKTWGIWFVVGGAVACLLTLGATAQMFSGKRMLMTKGQGCEMMDSHKGGMMNMMDGEHGDGMDMSMKGMTMMLEGKTGDAFDAAFLEMMIPHHEGAIDMAELAQKYAGHAELKAMANDIIEAQQSEIDLMKSWQESWGFTN